METWLDHKSNQVHTPVWRFNLNSFLFCFFMSILTVTLLTPDVKWVRTELWIVFALGLIYVVVHQRGLIFWRRISWSKNVKMCFNSFLKDNFNFHATAFSQNILLDLNNLKSFSQSLEHFFLTVGQNNFGNKMSQLSVQQKLREKTFFSIDLSIAFKLSLSKIPCFLMQWTRAWVFFSVLMML